MAAISRNSFLKQCIGLGMFVGVSPLLKHPFATVPDDDFYAKVVKANTQEVNKLIKSFAAEITDLRRRLGFDFVNLTAAYCEPTSPFYQKEELIPYLTKIIRFLATAQKEDGTLDLGNLASPPDTAFILEPLCSAAFLLQTQASPALNGIKTELKTFITKSGEGLKTGGVHTPNHRWVVSAALAKIHAVYPDAGYVKRIDQWLSEHVFIDAEGHYLERSIIYSEVIDRCLITIARLLKRPELLEPVRRNLNMTYYYLEPNGELVTNDSRRQDQFMTKNILEYYHHYRYLAIRDNNATYAGITKFIETVHGFEDIVLNDLLYHFLEEPLYKKPLPTAQPLVTNFEKFFKSTNLVRIRRDSTTTTIFGGTDWPLIIASGRSTSPNFFGFRKGDAILKYMRFSTDFFSTGYFRSKGITRIAEGKYELRQKIEAPYYQPLPDAYKRADGDYQHSQSTDGRFWNKMDFEHRPQSNVKTLETTIVVEEKNGVNELTFSSKGTTGVRVTIEFCFKEGGQLIGVKKLDGPVENYTLEGETGQYKAGKDTITFGPGTFKHARLNALEGEMYTSHFGSLRTEGLHVFLTAITPFEHKLIMS
ncbi:MAG: hypothetical protein U0Y10_24250 [Spirosomataceae bacterium]